MKKIAVLILCTSTIIFSLLFGGCSSQNITNYDDEVLIDHLSDKLIRFHVLANSDSEEDQALKQRVKDKVVEYLMPKLQGAKSLDEAREILYREDDSIKALAEAFIESSGYSYKVSTELTRDNFPVKRYGSVELPQGEYEAYRILIGSGQGQNWWCVMFPPLCFVDVTMGEVEEEKTLKTMEKYLTSEEMEAIKAKNEDNRADSDEITFRFAFIDMLKDIFK